MIPVDALKPQLAKNMKKVASKTLQFFKVNSLVITSTSSSIGSGCSVCVVICFEIGCCLRSVSTLVMVS